MLNESSLIALSRTCSTCSSTVIGAEPLLMFPISFLSTTFKASSTYTVMLFCCSISGSYLKLSRYDMMFFWFLRITLKTTSAHFWKMPFSRSMPIASITFAVSLNGTISGTFSRAPFSKMQSKSTCVISPVC